MGCTPLKWRVSDALPLRNPYIKGLGESLRNQPHFPFAIYIIE